MDTPDPYKNPLIILLVSGLFALFAGTLGSVMRTLDRGATVRFTYLFVVALVSAFTGTMVGIASIKYGADIWTSLGLSGMFGWMGAAASLNIGKALLFKALNVTSQDVRDANHVD